MQKKEGPEGGPEGGPDGSPDGGSDGGPKGGSTFWTVNRYKKTKENHTYYLKFRI